MVPREEPGGTRDVRAFNENLLAAARDAGRPLATEVAARLTAHYRLLREWGRRTNLTGLRSPEAILKRHFLEPIAAADLLEGEGTLLDIGSGNGFPAIPLAILHPGARLVLVEASEKKSAFLWTVLREVGLKAARVVTRRVCRRADLGDFLPVRWFTFRGVKVSDPLSGPGPQILLPGGRMLAFLAADDAREMAAHPPEGLRWTTSRPLPTSPEDVVAVFEPSR
jgi:16S rRNA (guanine(527)-N(7))-methyltransferase RsmG